MGEFYIRTDEAEDVLGSLRHVLRTSLFLADDPQSWKWAILALHSALQGACVCHLTTTAAPIGALTKKSTYEWLQYLETSRTVTGLSAPQTQIMPLPDLLKAVRKEDSAGGPGEGSVALDDKDLTFLIKIHEQIRNRFVHFSPHGWSIEVSGIPRFANLVARIIEDVLQVGWGFRHLDVPQREELRRSLGAVVAINWVDRRMGSK